MNADGLLVDRVVEVMVTLPSGGRRGSGYLVAPGTILTTAHVVAGATRVRVRFDADRLSERIVDAVPRWRHPAIDLSVLTLPVPDPAHETLPAARFGRVSERDAVLRCSALGFPRFKMRTAGDGSRYRDTEHVQANCAVLSNRREGTLDLRVAPPAADPDPTASPWEGMSGAVVLSGDLIVGVIAEHHRPDGLGRLAARRVDRWSELLTEEERRELEDILGCGLTPAQLPEAGPPAPALSDLVVAAHQTALRDIAPEELTGRDTELARLVEFCSGGEPYLWLQAPPWAGKTALTSWFALHPPQGVVPVSFFVTARLAGQADSTAYGDTLIHQLAVLAGREPARQPAAHAEIGLLLDEAAKRVAGDGGTLLLVVDGLDEDESGRLPNTRLPSIASQLPKRLPPHVRVLVTSRPGPGLSTDVPGDHPLRRCPIWTLEPSVAARHTEHEARHDLSVALSVALSGDDLARDVVGLLAAALGSLTSGDLHELTGQRLTDVSRLLTSRLGRILEARGVDDSDEHGYSFAHQTLLAAALAELGPEAADFRTRIDAWAMEYRRRGWPPSTPRYLFQPYVHLVVSTGDLDLAVAMATDVRRHDRMRAITGSDAAALDEITTVGAAQYDGDRDDLAALAAVAAADDLMARRNHLLPPRLPIAVARLGHARRAVGLARSVFLAAHRATALAGVAQALAEAGDQQAVSLAREALRLAKAAYEYADDFTPRVDDAIRMGAAALMTAGQKSEALTWLDPQISYLFGPAPSILTRVAVAVAAHPRDPGCAAELLAEAAAMASKARQAGYGFVELAVVAAAYVATDPAQATLLYRRIARARSKASMDELIAAADALRDVRPRWARSLAESAVAEAKSEEWLWRDSGPEPLWGKTADVAHALAVAGEVAEAQELAESIPESGYRRVWFEIALGWARAGHTEHAWRALEKAWNEPSLIGWLDGYERPEGALEVAEALVAAGCGEQARPIVFASADRYPWAAAEALAVLAERANPPDEALRLVTLAEQVVIQASFATLDVDRDERIAAVAVGLAATGHFADAERLLPALTSPFGRVLALAGMSVAHAKVASPEASRLAHAAADLAGDVDELFVVQAVSAAAHALCRVGAVKRAMALATTRRKQAGLGEAEHYGTVLIAAAAGATAFDPATATALLDQLERQGGDANARLVRYVQLLAAVGHRDLERATRFATAARGLRRPPERPQDAISEYRRRESINIDVLGCLLATDADVAEAREWLNQARADLENTERDLDIADGGPLAIAYAAFGDHDSAIYTLTRITDWHLRGQAISALAAYTAQLQAGPMLSCGAAAGPDWLDLTRRLAAIVRPPAPDDQLDLTYELLATALRTDGWHHTIPVLVTVEPDALLSIRDVVFSHLRIDGSS